MRRNLFAVSVGLRKVPTTAWPIESMSTPVIGSLPES